MWIWNDSLSHDEIIAQIKDMAEHNALSPMVVPEPKSFRPKTMPTRLEPEYLCDKYLEYYRSMVEIASKVDMSVWLYDEGGWPSGSVCGTLVKQNPNLVQQKLLMRKRWVWKGKTIHVPKNALIGILLFRTETGMQKKIINPGSSYKITEKRAKFSIYEIQKQGSYPDLLNPNSTKKFIEMTHERYKNAVHSYFGNTIPLIFTDEPKIAQKPAWTDGLAESFFSKFGYNVLEHLDSLFGGKTDEDQRTRIDYFDWWSSRFAEAYFGQIQNWCHKNGLLSGGHLNGEDETIGAYYHGYGHHMRPFRKMDIPGVDVIWRQLWPGKRNHHFPKYASSVSHQNGTPWALSESFAVYGTGLKPIEMKWVIDYQLVRGITLFDLAVYQYSNSDWFIGGERPIFGPNNPIWKGMPLVHEYIARLSYLLSLGTPDIPVAVYYPVRDIWAQGEEVHSTISNYDFLCEYLFSQQMDYDFIDDDCLSKKGCKIEKNKLIVGSMEYYTIILSNTRWIREESIGTLNQFIENGGSVYIVDCEVDSILRTSLSKAMFISHEELKNRIKPILTLKSKDKNNEFVHVMRRTLDLGNLYFIQYEGTAPLQTVVEFYESNLCYLLNPIDGSILQLKTTEKESHCVNIPMNLTFGSSFIFLFSSSEVFFKAEDGESFISQDSNPLLKLDSGWKAKRKRSFEIAKSGLIIHDFDKNEETFNVELGDWSKKFGADYSGEINYELSFNCDRNICDKAKFLDLGETQCISEVFLNGNALGIRIWPPYRYNIENKLREGNNHLDVIVTNTFANRYIHTKWNKLWPKHKLGPYHPKALRFEKDGLKSGLFGPVVIF